MGGMTIGSLFTLFVVPALYVLLAAEHSEARGEEVVADDLVAPSPAE